MQVTKSKSLGSAITKSKARRRQRSEGFILLALMLFMAVVAIGLLTVWPAIKLQIRRDNEEEMTHRALEYSRAVKRFYRKFGRYPARIEELENTNEVRSLRKRYKDPITGEDFKILHLADIMMMNGGTGQPGFGGLGNVNGPNGPPNRGQGGLNANSNQSGPTGAQSTQANDPTNAGNKDAQGNSNSDQGDQPGPLGGSGEQFGGGPIVGVASASKDQTIREYNKKNHYNDWLFIYLPTMDRGGLLNGPVFPDQMNMGFAPPQQQGVPASPNGNLTGAPGMAPPPPGAGQPPQGPPNPNPEPQPPDQ
jgi:type II secretory pathway pseudopilin PulG